MLQRLLKPANRLLARPSRRVTGILLILAILFGPGLVYWVRLSIQQYQMDRRLLALSAEHERLAQQRKRLETDPGYLEGYIRSTFKMAKPGEYVIPLESANKKRLASD